ncbi:Heterochromatin protein 1 [Frankliniella fusca]|uniref:Heterochromatin protein 1 n=1 Tax=Frankliniella fusca TaxID=407009 RepID=A0AAE1H245_9NEOP|nr:Heterochromatin protein 1 [Frankliniella fusca]
MEEEGIDPSTVNKNPKVIKAAQEEISCMDVLVCGKCHVVFHFIEEFQEHKDKNECSTPVFKGNLSEPKPQVWAFLLWKSSQAKPEGDGGDQISSWKLYQKWCKMPDNIREAWISAGKAIQVSTTLASAKMQEIKSPIPKGTAIPKQGLVRKVVKGKQSLASVPSQPASSENAVEKKDDDKKDDLKVEDQNAEQGNGDSAIVTEGFEIKEEQVSEAEAAFEDEDEEEEERLRRLEAGESIEEIDKSIQRQRQQSLHTTLLKKKTDGEAKISPLSKTGIESEDEFVVERIVSRRYNIRKKAYEYLLKWEGYADDQNTWEPAENLADCKHLLENFERNLAKQKQLQAQGKDPMKRGPSGLPPGPKMITSDVSNASTPKQDVPARGRPVRSSKKKAMDQVKAWCGSMSTKKMDEDGMREGSDMSDDEDGMRKHKRSSESEDMSQYDGLSADELPIKRRRKEDEEFLSVRRGPGRPRKIVKINGESPGSTPIKSDSANQELAKTLLGEFISGLDGSSGKGPIVLGKKPDGTTISPSQQPVLVANSKGVVKVDPRTMPNISSGVYIMSTKPGPNGGSGLVKIDSPNVKVVTGVGQKQGGIMAVKDAKSTEADSNSGLGTSPIKTTVLGKKPQTIPSSSSTVTPMKLGPKLVSPQMKGGLIKVTPSPRPVTGAAAGGLSGPRPLISSSVRPGLVRNTLGSGPRPALVSPRLPTVLGGARGGIRPVRPKQALTVQGGRTVSSPMGSGVKSGIRPIEAMLGSGAQTPTSIASSSNLTPKSKGILEKKDSPQEGLIKKDTASLLIQPGAAKLKQEVGRGGMRGRGRGRGGHTMVRSLEDKSKSLSSEGLNLDFTEDRSAESDSDSDCGLPDDFPTGDMPLIPPASPERPLTLCPLTGKILARAEGEKTPPPTPPPEPVPSPQPTPPPSNTVLLEEESLEGGEQTLIKVEMSPGGTTGTVVGDEGTTLLRTSGGLTVKRMQGGSSGRSGNLLSTVSQVTTNAPMQDMSLTARKLFTEDGQEVIAPETEMVTIQGPDGVVYQVQGQLEDGAQTLLVQGEDGEQSCVYVTTNQEGEDGSTVLTLDSAYADALAQVDSNQVSILGDGSQLLVQNEDGTTTLSDSQLMSVMEGGDKEDTQAQIVAQVVQAGDAPPGGGPRNVVLLLPDGNLMVTEVDEEQYAALELEKQE